MKITEKDGRFYDKNGNSWSNLELAEMYASTLIDCKNCSDCKNCRFCDSCSDCYLCYSCDSCSDCNFSCSCDSCSSCDWCHSCTSCRSCVSCRSCNSCNLCRSCTSCNSCNLCYSCISCNSCRMCEYCKGYTVSPQRYLSAKIGSRNAQTTVYWTSKEDIQILCGCFRGDLQKFEEAVNNRHLQGSKWHAEYMALINVLKTIIK